ncbi:MAG: hypothetical protein QOJ81_905 [Chloroflexota bacterium]|nr:hypothetical protein [Chloroflexota bacterium]
MTRAIQVGIVLLFLVAAAYALFLMAIMILASFVHCACAATPSPPNLS